MKTNALFTLLLAAVVAFVMGCATTPGGGPKLDDWQSKIGGSYKSIIYNGNDEYPAKTTFKTEGGKVTGVYELDVYGTQYTGDLSKFSLIGDRKFKCRWHDNVDRRGNFSMTFSADGSSFKGEWDADDGNGDGAWNGKK